MQRWKKYLAFILAAGLCFAAAGCGDKPAAPNTGEPTETALTQTAAAETAAPSPTATMEEKTVQNSDSRYDGMTAQDITASLTLEQKAYQMVCPALYAIDAQEMRQYDYGALLSSVSDEDSSDKGWKTRVLALQALALESEAAIPYLYGTDAVHGIGYCENAVLFPHNIGIGAANDAETTYQMGLAVGDELKLTGMLWNYSPCVAVDSDPRWGRTYESYSSDPATVQSLAASYAKGLLDAGIVVCAKHFIGDGSVQFGTGEDDMIIDRGDAILTDEQLQTQLAIYQALIDEGVQTVMVSHSSLNGVKMHENGAYITDVLKGQMGFTGFVVSDWESIHHISGGTLKEQVITAVNAGIDMLMEPEKARECAGYIIEAVGEGAISMERVNDAVLRIVRVKLEAGLFDDPLQKELITNESAVGGDEYRTLAAKLVEESLVLLKNDGDVLPLKKGSSVLVIGPASDQTGVYCGGWTTEWLGVTNVKGGSTILDGLNELAQTYDLKILTDPAKVNEADVIVLCIGESTYSEWLGDAEDMGVTGGLSLPGVQQSIQFAKQSGKPVIACIIAGRNLLIEEYMADWDAIVMCYLPGTEAKAIAHVLTGEAGFSGKLAMPWYATAEQIGTAKNMFPVGFGLTY